MKKMQARRFEGPSLDDLGVLRAAIQAGSFVRAGEILGLTQSAVSRAIARLEHRVGVRMFRRSARAVAVTEEGLRFYESVAPHLGAIEDATIQAAGSAATVRGRLRVNVDAGIGQFLIGPRLEPFLSRYPELSIDLVVTQRMGDLVQDGFDVAVRFGLPQPSSLRSRLLLRTRVVTCASPGYAARHGIPARPKDVEDHECVQMRDRVTGRPFDWVFVRGKKVVAVNATGRLVVNDTGALLAACHGGQGLTQLIELYARDAIADGRLVQVLPDWPDELYPLHAYYPSEQVVSAKVRAFLDWVVELTR